MNLTLRFFDGEFAVCSLRDLAGIDLSGDLFFLSRTPDEVSLVCPAGRVPDNALKIESGWSLFRVDGVLDFGLIGILSKITALLAEHGISVFAVSTFATDYFLVKTAVVDGVRSLFQENGYGIL